ncbi:MAG: EamA family transporter [Desulfatirhabdiaceae bacterium]
MRGYFFIIAAAAQWAMIGPFARLAFQEGVPPMEVAFWRALLTWFMFAIHATIRGETRLKREDIGFVIIFGLSGVSLFYGAYQMAVKQGGAALAAVLLYTAPAWVTVLARIFFREKITLVKLMSLVLTLVGVAAISGAGQAGDGQSISVSALLFGLVSGFCYSLYYIFGRHFSGRYSSPNLFLYLLPIGILGLLPWTTFTHKSPTAWMALIFLSLVSTYGANFCYYASLKYLEASRASIMATLEPVITVIVAYFWWQESLSAISLIGCALILTAVVMVVAEKKTGNS